MEEILIDSIPGIIYGGLAGFFLLGTKNYFDRDRNISKNLTFEPEAFDQDRNIGEAFLRLQTYRAYDTKAFEEGGNEVDSLLCLEKQIINQEILPTLYHPMYGTRYARKAKAYLKQLGHCIQVKVQNKEKAKYAQEQINVIAKRVDYHVKNITGLYKAADKRVSRPMFNYPMNEPVR